MNMLYLRISKEYKLLSNPTYKRFSKLLSQFDIDCLGFCLNYYDWINFTELYNRKSHNLTVLSSLDV